jgi:hypothetical protein
MATGGEGLESRGGRKWVKDTVGAIYKPSKEWNLGDLDRGGRGWYSV